MIYFIGNPPAIPDVAYKMASIEDAVAYLETLDEMGLDIETTGLYHWESRMVMLIIGDKKHQYVIDTRYVDIQPLKPIIENNDKCKILHNGVFDYKFLKKEDILLEYMHDTQRTEYVINGSVADPYISLATLVYDYCNGFMMDKTVRSSFIDMGPEPFTTSQIVYGAGDVTYLLDIRKQQMKKASERELGYVVRLENASYLAVAEMEYNGLRIDEKAWTELAKIAEKESAEIVVQLNKVIETDDLFENCRIKYLQTDLFIDDDDLSRVAINWASPKQVLRVMNNVDKTLTGVAEDVLGPIGFKHSIIALYLKNQEYKKRMSTYGVDFFKYIDADGLVHTSFTTVGTGRFSSNAPNLQNIPADNRYRNCFLPPEEDMVFVSGDYSSQELALIAHDSKDPVWTECLEKSEDLHSVCAELIFGDAWATAAEKDCAYYEIYETHSKPDENGKILTLTYQKKQKCSCPKHKKLRTSIKTINFGLAYGMTKYKLADRVGISVAEAEKLIEAYFKTFFSIKDSLEQSAYFAKVNGYIRTMEPYGRIRDFPEWSDEDTPKKEMARIERQAKNSRIQGSGADMIKEALIRTRRRIIDDSLPVMLVLTVHDQIDLVTTKEYAEKCSAMLKEVMEESALSIIPSGLLKAEVNISPVWQK